MITLQLLEDEDEVLPEYWCRPLELLVGEHINSFDDTKPQNHFKWVRVSDVLGKAWWGQKLKNIREVLSTDNKSIFPYEVIKGDIPLEHQLWYKQDVF